MRDPKKYHVPFGGPSSKPPKKMTKALKRQVEVVARRRNLDKDGRTALINSYGLRAS